MAEIKVGDIVLSLCGHDKDNYFVVIKTEGNKAFIADGKTRKVCSAKVKNIKHLRMVNLAIDEEIASRILTGKPVGNEKLRKAIKSQTKKIQED